jgi:chaperonin GroES
MSVRPLQDRIIVQRLEGESMTAAGLFIPETAKERPQQGKVIAAGAGKKKPDGTVRPMDVKVGDLILFGRFAGSETKIDGTEYIIMREEDVLGVIEEGE